MFGNNNEKDLYVEEVPLREPTLLDHVNSARETKITERKKLDITGVDIWLAEHPFVSAYPDRVNVKEATNVVDAIQYRS